MEQAAALVGRLSGSRLAPGRTGWLLVAAALPALAGCASSARPAVTPATAFAIAGPSLGLQHLAPTECRSGDRQGFFGADLIDPAAALVARVVLDPLQGTVVRLFPLGDPSTTGLVLTRSDCSTFHASVERTGTTVNEIVEMRVELELDCRTVRGDTVRGAAQRHDCL